jgi:protein phosphatase 1 regulatory subunit 7
MRPVERSTRIDNPSAVQRDEIAAIAARGELAIVQFSRPCYDMALLEALDALCLEFGEHIEMRFYGHPVDCGVVAMLAQVQRLSLDCLRTVKNFTALRTLARLTRLSIGIEELEAPDFLAWPNLHCLTHLTLAGAGRPRVDLDHLRHFRRLHTLSLHGHTKNIAALGEVVSLSDLTLNIAGATNIAFINALPRLARLGFMLGGRANLDELTACPIEELEIVRVKGFERLDRLDRFPRLRRLDVADQARLTQLSIDAQLSALSYLRITSSKAFTRLDGLHLLPNLETLWLYRTALDFDALFAQPLPARLQKVGFFTGRSRADAALRLRLEQMGYYDGLARH